MFFHQKSPKESDNIQILCILIKTKNENMNSQTKKSDKDDAYKFLSLVQFWTKM